jgi:hypothetical protein
MTILRIDAREVSRLSAWCANLTGKQDKIAAIAATAGVKAARDRLARDVFPRIAGGPTAWTRRGLRYWRADRTRQPDRRGMGSGLMVAAVGWNYGDNDPTDPGFSAGFGRMGVPSGRYMQLLAAGGTREPKSTEIKLYRSGLLRKGQFITPQTGWDKIDTQGNIKGSEYKRILSRLKVDVDPGSTQATTGPGSRRRTARKRATTDYFPMRDTSGRIRFIAQRIGDSPSGASGKGKPGRPLTVGYKRGFFPVLHVIKQAPRYEAKINIHQIAWAAYTAAFPIAFDRALKAELGKLATI